MTRLRLNPQAADAVARAIESRKFAVDTVFYWLHSDGTIFIYTMRPLSTIFQCHGWLSGYKELLAQFEELVKTDGEAAEQFARLEIRQTIGPRPR